MKSIASLALALCVVAGSTRAQVGIETRPRRRSLRSGLTPGRSLALVRSFYGRLTRATFRQRRSRRLTLPRWRPRASTSPVGVELTCARSSRVALARSLALRATHFARSLVRSFARSLVRSFARSLVRLLCQEINRTSRVMLVLGPSWGTLSSRSIPRSVSTLPPSRSPRRSSRPSLRRVTTAVWVPSSRTARVGSTSRSRRRLPARTSRPTRSASSGGY